MKSTRRWLAGLMAVTILALLAGAPALAAEDLNPVGTFPIAKTKTPLKILMQQDVLVENYETNAFTLWLEELCNVDLSFELLPAGQDGLDKLAIMLSSGQELPDIINIPMTVLDDYVYGSAGLLVDMTDMYETQAYHIKQRAEEFPTVPFKEQIRTPDGKLYSIPQYYHETIADASKRMWVNKDFLAKLNLAVPTTTDELYEVLKAIKTGDPNGNGQADEIPLIAADTGYLMGNLMNAFVYTNPSNNYYTVKDGQVGVSYTTDAFREGLRYMNRLCAEGLLSPLTFTQTGDQLKQTTDSDGVHPVVGVGIQFSVSLLLNNWQNNPFTAMYEAIPPLKGPEGVQFTEYTPAVAKNWWHVTKYCKNPELAFRVGDAMFSEEGFLRSRFAVPGTHWDYAPAGLPSYFEGRDAKFTYTSIWLETQNFMWRMATPAFTFDDPDLRVWNGNLHDATYACAVSCPAYLACIPKEGGYVPNLSYTPDEAEEINELQSTLNTYVKESIARFITGDMSVEKDWDAFQNELKAIGLEDFLRVSQQAYDRRQ